MRSIWDVMTEVLCNKTGKCYSYGNWKQFASPKKYNLSRKQLIRWLFSRVLYHFVDLFSWCVGWAVSFHVVCFVLITFSNKISTYLNWPLRNKWKIASIGNVMDCSSCLSIYSHWHRFQGMTLAYFKYASLHREWRKRIQIDGKCVVSVAQYVRFM